MTLQAVEAGDIGVALLFTIDPNIPARHLVVLADDRGLRSAENITPLVGRDVIVRYGPGVVALLNVVSALLDPARCVRWTRGLRWRGRTPGWWPAAGCVHRG